MDTNIIGSTVELRNGYASQIVHLDGRLWCCSWDTKIESWRIESGKSELSIEQASATYYWMEDCAVGQWTIQLGYGL
jgi:hypothetical protein